MSVSLITSADRPLEVPYHLGILAGKVLMKLQVCNSKYEPLVNEVDLLHANPEYAFVHMPDGSEATVSLKHLAPPAFGNANDYNTKSYLMKINKQNDTDVVNSNDNSNIPPEKNTLPLTSPDPTLIT